MHLNRLLSDGVHTVHHTYKTEKIPVISAIPTQHANLTEFTFFFIMVQMLDGKVYAELDPAQQVLQN